MVYSCTGLKGEALVAKKFRESKCRSPEGVSRSFVRELVALGSLRHRNVVSLVGVGVGEHDGLFYLVMPRVQRGISEFCASRPGRKRLLRALKGLAAGVAYLHESGFCHCDVKPDNLMVDSSGEGVVIDLGLARRRVTAPNVVSDRYKAPELLLETGEYGPPLDVWACGCVFAEAACGAKVFPKGGYSSLLRVTGLPGDGSWPRASSSPKAAYSAACLRSGAYGDSPGVRARLLSLGMREGDPLLSLCSHMLSVRPGDRPTSEDVYARLSEMCAEAGEAPGAAREEAPARKAASSSGGERKKRRHAETPPGEASTPPPPATPAAISPCSW